MTDSGATATSAGQNDTSRDDGSPGSRLALFGWPGLGVMTLITLAGVWHGVTSLVLLGSLVVRTGLVARGWAGLALWGLIAERRISGARAFPGDVVTLEIRMENRKPLPLSWVRVEQTLADALRPMTPTDNGDATDDPAVKPGLIAGTARLIVETPLGWYRTATLTRQIECRKRGWYPLGPLTVASADAFGLFVRTRQKDDKAEIIVFPRIQALADAGLPARHPIGSTRDAMRLFEDPSRPMGIREYGPETPFKHIDWKATARTGQFQATIFEPTVTLETVVLLAVDGFEGPDADDLFETGVSVAASLAHQEFERRRPVGLFANGQMAPSGAPIVIPAGRKAGIETMMLEALARITRKTTSPLAAFLDQHAARLGIGTTLTVIASHLSGPALARLDALSRRGRPVVLLLVGDGEPPNVRFACRRVGLLTRKGAAA